MLAKRVHIFRSLPLSSDSRTERNALLFPESTPAFYVWDEREENTVRECHYSIRRRRRDSSKTSMLSFLLFALWVPWMVLRHARRGDTVVLMDLECAIFGTVVARAKGCTTIFDLVDTSAAVKAPHSPKLWPILNRLEILMSQLCHATLLPSQQRQTIYGGRIRRALELENIPLEMSETTATSRQMTPDRGCLCIGYLGTVVIEPRALDVLIELAKFAPEKFEVLFAGDGSDAPRLETLCRNLPNVHYLGSFRPADLPELYGRIDLTWAYFAFDNPFHRFASPNKFYEHLRFRTPILLTSVMPQAEDVLRRHTGVVAQPEDSVMDLSRKILDYFENISMSRRHPDWDHEFDGYYPKKAVELARLLRADVNAMEVRP